VEAVDLLPWHHILGLSKEGLLVGSGWNALVEEMSFILKPLVHVLQIVTEVDVVHGLWLDTVGEG
jgi:hypothetical protein